ncbi:MAG: hypothetical protein ACI8QW_001031, partial [Saprospiraceae bacterium]
FSPVEIEAEVDCSAIHISIQIIEQNFLETVFQ